MDNLTLCFALLMPLISCFGSTANNDNCGGKLSQSEAEVTLVKTIRRQTDVTPLCFNDTLNVVSLIVCKISTKRRGEKCFLSYRVGPGFENKCDSRVTLMTENQMVFLQFNSLTPEDDGNYTCECSCLEGTNIIHLNVTVEEASNSVPEKSFTQLLVIGVIILIIIISFILGFIYRVMHHGNRRRQERPASSPLTDQGEPDNPYEVLQHPSCDLYDTITYEHHPQDAKSDDCTSGNRRYRD